MKINPERKKRTKFAFYSLETQFTITVQKTLQC